jgi:hypothetical protein
LADLDFTDYLPLAGVARGMKIFAQQAQYSRNFSGTPTPSPLA